MINPAALLPGAVPTMPGDASLFPGMAPSSSSGVSSSSLSPSPATTPARAGPDREGGVSFDTPVQVTTLQSAHKVWFLFFLFVFVFLIDLIEAYYCLSYFSDFWVDIVSVNLLSCRVAPKVLHFGDPSPEQRGSKRPKDLWRIQKRP